MFRNPVTDLIVVVIVALLIFGPKRLPMLGRALGHGMREFKEGITGESKADEAERPALTPAAAGDPATQQTPAPAAPEPVATPAPGAPPQPAAPEPESAAAERRS
jgi:sec-independent protein translocase protein TatA